MPRVVLLTGTCGSGKTMIANLLSDRAGWFRISEDDVWHAWFGKNRGELLSAEHRCKRHRVHLVVFEWLQHALELGCDTVIEATVHENPPEAYEEYLDFFARHAIEWRLRVLHPRLEVAIERDGSRLGWRAGSGRVKQLWGKFTAEVFDARWLLDTSDESPEQTMLRVIRDSS